MRFYEIAIKPIKPLKPEQARIAQIKANVERSREQLARERDRQQAQRRSTQGTTGSKKPLAPK